MKKLNLWTLLFSALTVFAVTAFSSCVDDNEDNGMPYLSVSPETLAFSLDGVAEGPAAFEVQTNRPWKLTPQDGSEWVTIGATEGNGSASVEISVPGALEGRVATLDFQLSNSYGAYMTKTVYVKQGDIQIPGVLPTQVVTEFGDDFTAVENGTVYDSPYWAFTSSETGYPANPKLGWFGTIYSDGSHYLQCAPYSSNLATVTCYAIMTPFNVKEAADKSLSFKLAWYANTTSSSIDATKIEVVASTTVTDETATDDAEWTVIKTIQYTDADKMNQYNDLTADLSAYANDEKVYVAFRYVGHNNTYRLDDVSFNGGKPSTLVVEPETLAVGSAEGATATVKVTATDPWEAAIATGTGFTIENGSGSGDGEFIVKASAGNDTADEKELGTIAVTSVAGSKIVTVKQKGQSNDIYFESFGLPVKSGNWPYLDVYTGFLKQGSGFVDGTTTYKASQTSSRSVVNSNSPVPPCSGEGHCWFPANKTYATNYFEVDKLVVSGETNISFEFLLRGNTDEYKDGDLKFEISADGETWKELNFTLGTIPGLPADGDAKKWQMATKDITLKAAVEYLYVRWSSETTGGVRMDDPRIFVGTGGEEIDFGAPDAPSVTTADASNFQTTSATVGGALKNAQLGDYSQVGVYFVEKPAAGDADWSKATKKAAAAVATPWTVELTGLTANTTYLYHAYATPKTGEELVGADKEFKTTPAEITVAGNVVVAFSGADVATPALPTSETNGTATYTIGGLNYTISSPSYYFRDYASASYGEWPYTTLYVKGGDPAGYIDLPAVEGKKLTKIELASAGNMGGYVELSVLDAQGKSVAGGESKKFEQTSLTNPTLTTFVLTGTEANTSYRLNVDKSNAQFHKIGLTYEDAAGPVELKLNPATAAMEFEAAADAAGKTQTYTITGDAAGLQLFASVADETNFSAETSDKTVTVKALTANDGTAPRTTTVTVYLATAKDAEHKAEATIEVTQKTAAVATTKTVAELFSYVKGLNPESKKDTPLTAWEGTKIEGVIAANNVDNNLFSMLSVVDNTGAAGSGIILGDAVYNTIANYPVGAKITISITAESTVYNNNGLYKLNKVATDVDKSSIVTPVVPSITVAQFNSNDYLGMVVSVTGLKFKGTVSEPWYSGTGTYANRTFTDGTNDLAVSLYKTVSWKDELISTTVTNGVLTGVAEVFSGKAQLYPQTAADVAAFKNTAPTILDITPASGSWEYNATAAKDFAVTISGDGALSVNSADIAPFTAAVNGTTITVTPPQAANETGADIVKTMIVSIAGGNSMNVTLTQKKKVESGDGAGAEWSYVFQDGDFVSGGATTEWNGLSWTYAFSPDNTTFSWVAGKSNRYQIGGSVNKVRQDMKTFTLSTSAYTEGIKSVKLGAAKNAASQATSITIYVGDQVVVDANEVPAPASVATDTPEQVYTFDKVYKGELRIVYENAKSDAKAGIFLIKNITINPSAE